MLWRATCLQHRAEPKRSFRQVGLDRLGAHHAIRAKTIAQGVQELTPEAVRPLHTPHAIALPPQHLLMRQRAQMRGPNRHPHHAVAEVDRLHPRHKERPQMADIPTRPAEGDHHPHRRGIDTVKLKLQLPGAAAALLKKLRQLRQQPADGQLDRLQLGGGSGKDTLGQERREGADRIDRLRRQTGGLIEPSQQPGPEAGRQRGSRQLKKMPDPLDAHLAKGIDHRPINPQGGYRKPRERLSAFTHDRPISRTEPGHRPGAGKGRTRRDPGHETQTHDLIREPMDKTLLATKQMLAAGNINEQAVRRINRHDRRELQRPPRQCQQGRLLALRLLRPDDRPARRQQSAGVSQGHPLPHPRRRGPLAPPGHDLPAGAGGVQEDGAIPRHATPLIHRLRPTCGRSAPRDQIGREVRQVQRHRLGHASTPQSTVGVEKRHPHQMRTDPPSAALPSNAAAQQSTWESCQLKKSTAPATARPRPRGDPAPPAAAPPEPAPRLAQPPAATGGSRPAPAHCRQPPPPPWRGNAPPDRSPTAGSRHPADRQRPSAAAGRRGSRRSHGGKANSVGR